MCSSDLYRIEIFSRTGSRGRDIMGYTKEQVISDVLDAYDAHIMYLTMSDEIGTATGTIPVTAPDTWDDADQVELETVDPAPSAATSATTTDRSPTTDPADGGRETKENHD